MGSTLAEFGAGQVVGNFKIYYAHPFSQYLPLRAVGAENLDGGSSDEGDIPRSQGDGTVVYEPLEAEDVEVDATAFSGNLGSTDTNVQEALETIDGLTLGGGGGGGTDDQDASEVDVDATQFSGNLGSTDTDVQAALETIDGFTLGGGGTPYTLPQATEATRGGVQGATAVQAIATSGTTILGWTNNRLRQIIAAALPTATAAQAIAATGTARVIWTVTRIRAQIMAALPTMTQTDITNSTTDRKAVTGALIAANTGGDAASVDGFSIQSVTQVEYDALTPDANTFYFIP